MINYGTKGNNTLLQISLAALEMIYGSFENVVSSRNNFITQFEGVEDNYRKGILLKEIIECENTIDSFSVLYFKLKLKFPENMEGEGYKQFAGQTEMEVEKDHETTPNKYLRDKNGLTYTECKYIDLYKLTNEYKKKNDCSVNQSVIMVYKKNQKTIFNNVDWSNVSLNGYYYKGKKLIIKQK